MPEILGYIVTSGQKTYRAETPETLGKLIIPHKHSVKS